MVGLTASGMLVAGAVALPLVRQRMAVQELREAGFDVIFDARWSRSELLGRPIAVVGTTRSVKPHVTALLRVGPLQELNVRADPEVCRVLREQRQLRQVSLAGGRVTREMLECLTALPQLYSVSLLETDVNAPDLELLTRIPRLRHLSLARTPIDSEGLEILSRLKSLESLGLEQTGVSEHEVHKLINLLSGVDITDD